MSYYCSQCGAKMPENATFCSECGAPMDAPVAEAVYQPEMAYAPVEEAVYAPEMAYAPVEEAVYAPEMAYAPVEEAVYAPEMAYAPVEEAVYAPEVAYAPVEEAVYAPEMAYAPVEEAVYAPEMAYAPVEEAVYAPEQEYAPVVPAETAPGQKTKKKKEKKEKKPKKKRKGLRALIVFLVIVALLALLVFAVGNYVTLKFHTRKVLKSLNSGSIDLSELQKDPYEDLPHYVIEMMGEVAEPAENGPIVTAMTPYLSFEVAEIRGFWGNSEVEYRIVSRDLSGWLLDLDYSTVSSSEELQQMILDYIPQAPVKEYYVTIQYYRSGIFGWRGDYEIPAFADAVSGGLNTAYNELYQQMMEEMEDLLG